MNNHVFNKRAYKKAELSEGPELLEVFGLEIFESRNSNSNSNSHSNSSSAYTKIGSRKTSLNVVPFQIHP